MTRAILAVAAAILLVPGPGLVAQGLDPPVPTNRELGDADGGDLPGEPLLSVDFPETEAVPGQFLTLRLTVLVPSFMPAPPVWPSFEAPNLLVRVPEGATRPTSERIGGETWSGITRRYRISPMVPGAFEIPPQEIVVTWAPPDAAATPERVALSTGPLAFAGVIPEGAEGLDPFLAASDLTLTQEIEGTPGAMLPGDSIRRTISVEVEGVSPMFLPELLTPETVPGLAAYPDEPRLQETDDRGALGGTRRESVTYVAESGGGGTLPAVALDWFDIDSGRVETASAESVEIAIDGPPPALADPADRRRLALLAAAGLVLAILFALLLRRALLPLRTRIAARRAARRASEAHAWRALQRTVRRRDAAALHPALDAWADRVHGPDPRRDADVQHALVALGQARYGGRSASADAARDAWRHLAVALRTARRKGKAPARDSALPPLNPGATT